MKIFLTAASAAFIALSGAATAATLSLDTTGARAGMAPAMGENPDSNDILNNIDVNRDRAGDLAALSKPLPGFFGAQVLLDQAARIKIEWIGYEAGNFNTFEANGATLFDTEAPGFAGRDRILPSAFGFSNFPTFERNFNAGVLDFAFTTVFPNDPLLNGAAVNGSNPRNLPAGDSSPAAINFFATFGDDETTMGDVLYLFFDDTGAGNDDNHDDLAVRLTVLEAVPLPGAALPLLTALGGLGFAASRRRRKAAKA